MKLYYSRGACSLVVRIIINELGLSCDYESVDLKSKKTESDTIFLTINPKGAVPTLQTDDGEVLTENAVILQYLADKFEATQLLAKVGDFKRYRILELLNYITTELHKSFGLLFNPNLTEEIKTNVIHPLIKNKFNYVNKQLTGKRFLLGDTFTLPDAYLFVMLQWALHFKFNLEEWEHLSNYHLELKKRPAVLLSLEQENLLGK